jgi:hypothetical protein
MRQPAIRLKNKMATNTLPRKGLEGFAQGHRFSDCSAVARRATLPGGRGALCARRAPRGAGSG